MPLIGEKRRKRDGCGGVWDWEFEHDHGRIFRYVERDFDDYVDFTLTGLGIAASGTGNDKEKIEMPELPPVIYWKYPKLPGEDPVKRLKVWDQVTKEGLDRCRAVVNKAIARWKREEALVAIKDVNLGAGAGSEVEAACCCGEVVEKGSGSDSEMVVDQDQGTGSSSHLQLQLHPHSRL